MLPVDRSKGEALPDAISVYYERFGAGTIVLRHLGIGHQFGRFQDWSRHHIQSIGIGTVHIQIPVIAVDMKLRLTEFANTRTFYCAFQSLFQDPNSRPVLGVVIEMDHHYRSWWPLWLFRSCAACEQNCA